MLSVKMETLLCVAEHKNFTRAAEELSLTQPAVSHHIKELEQELGVPLFIRGKGGLKLTDQGEIAVRYARRIKALDGKLRSELANFEKNITNLKIGLTHTAESNLTTEALAKCAAQNPGLSITIATDTIKNLYDMMRSYELDVAIVDGQFPASGYTEVLLDTDYLCLVVSPIHPLARRASVAIGALQGERFIMRPKGAGTRSMFESYLSECGADIRDFNIIIEMDSVATIKELVAQDLGISVIAHSACREDEQAGRLAVVPLEKPGMVRRINMVHHQDFSHPEILEELRRLYIGRR